MWRVLFGPPISSLVQSPFRCQYLTTCSRSFFHLLVRSWFAQAIASALLSLNGFLWGWPFIVTGGTALVRGWRFSFSSSFSLSWVVHSCWESETSNYWNQHPLWPFLVGTSRLMLSARLFRGDSSSSLMPLNLASVAEAVGLSIVLGFEGVSGVLAFGAP